MKPRTPSAHLALMLTAQTEAASERYLKLIYAGGVFHDAERVSAERLGRGERGYTLMPNAYGGEWSLVLGSGADLTTHKVHLTYLGGDQTLTHNLAHSGPTIGRLMARLTSGAATSCFHLSAERLPALKSWVEASVRSGAQSDVNTERRFGPLRVQVLTSRREQQADVDVLLWRGGSAGSAGQPPRPHLEFSS